MSNGTEPRWVYFTKGATRYLMTLRDWERVTFATTISEFDVYNDTVSVGDDCYVGIFKVSAHPHVGTFKVSAHPHAVSDERLIEIARDELAGSL